MRVTVVFNPISGAGRGAVQAARIAKALRAARHDAREAPTQLAAPAEWLDPLLADAQALVVVGGDGAMRMVAESAARTDTPVFQYPAGTENLFAREFGMRPREDMVLRALERNHVQRIDLARANGTPFLLMVSIGYDAEVVHDLCATRSGAISHLSYLPCMLRQLGRWNPGPLELCIDGASIELPGRGCLIIANSRHYGFRLNPAWRAEMSDGELDIVFIPSESRLSLISLMMRYRLGRQPRDRRVTYLRGRVIEVATTAPRRFQIDGDRPLSGTLTGNGSAGHDAGIFAQTLRITVEQQALPVLLPA